MADYYQSSAGKLKKKLLNRRRCRNNKSTIKPIPSREERISIVDYLCKAISLIEGRAVSKNEILVLLEKIMRQHRLFKPIKNDYAGQYHDGG